MTRRGAQLVEFALLTPILLTLVAGVVDAGEYLHRLEALVNATADGARAGARTETDPVSTARTAATAAWAATGVMETPTFDAGIESVAPNQRLVVSASVAFEPYFGLVPMPDHITYACAFRLDHQPED